MWWPLPLQRHSVRRRFFRKCCAAVGASLGVIVLSMIVANSFTSPSMVADKWYAAPPTQPFLPKSTVSQLTQAAVASSLEEHSSPTASQLAVSSSHEMSSRAVSSGDYLKMLAAWNNGQFVQQWQPIDSMFPASFVTDVRIAPRATIVSKELPQIMSTPKAAIMVAPSRALMLPPSATVCLPATNSHHSIFRLATGSTLTVIPFMETLLTQPAMLQKAEPTSAQVGSSTYCHSPTKTAALTFSATATKLCNLSLACCLVQTPSNSHSAAFVELPSHAAPASARAGSFYNLHSWSWVSKSILGIFMFAVGVLLSGIYIALSAAILHVCLPCLPWLCVTCFSENPSATPHWALMLPCAVKPRSDERQGVFVQKGSFAEQPELTMVSFVCSSARFWQVWGGSICCEC